MLIRLAATACAAGIVTVLLAAAPIIPDKQLAATAAAPMSAKIDDLSTQPATGALAPRAVRPKQRNQVDSWNGCMMFP